MSGTIDTGTGIFQLTGSSQFFCTTLTLTGTAAQDGNGFAGGFDCSGITGVFTATRVVVAVPPVTNPLNPSGIPLEADGRFCPNTDVPCVQNFPGNVGGQPIPASFEWRGIVPLAFVPGPNASTPVLLSNHAARSFVYTATDTEPGGGGAISLYLMYDFLSRLLPFQPGERPAVAFDVGPGSRFAGRMLVTFLCAEGQVIVSGLDNGVPFFDRPADQLGIEGACGLGESPNPTGDSFFDVFTDVDLLDKGFNVPHTLIELEVPLTRNLGEARTRVVACTIQPPPSGARRPRTWRVIRS